MENHRSQPLYILKQHQPSHTTLPPPNKKGKTHRCALLCEAFNLFITRSMDAKKPSNKITEIVRLQQMLKKWKKLALTPKSNSTKSIGFLKRTLSFSDTSSAVSSNVPKGFLAVCVGEEQRRFVIPTDFLSDRAFVSLLSEAEEEFGFQQAGILRIPCEVSVFEDILKVVEEKKKEGFFYWSSEAEMAQSYHLQKQMCR